MFQEVNFVTDPIVTHIWFSLHNHCYDEALFCAERLYAETNHEEALYLVAKCYFTKNLYKQACTLLKVKGCTLPKTKFLLARCHWELNEPIDAEIALLGSSHPYNNVPLEEVSREYGDQAAYILLLLGDIYRYQGQDGRARECLELCLKVNPLMWTAFERLCDLCPHIGTSNTIDIAAEDGASLPNHDSHSTLTKNRATVDPASVFQMPVACNLSVPTLHVPTQSVLSSAIGPNLHISNSSAFPCTSATQTVSSHPPREVLSTYNRSNTAAMNASMEELSANSIDGVMLEQDNPSAPMETVTSSSSEVAAWSSTTITSSGSPANQHILMEQDKILSRENLNPHDGSTSGNRSIHGTADSESVHSPSSVNDMSSSPYTTLVQSPNMAVSATYDSPRTPDQPIPSSRIIPSAPKATPTSRLGGGHHASWLKQRNLPIPLTLTSVSQATTTNVNSCNTSILDAQRHAVSPMTVSPVFGMLGMHMHSPLFAAVPVFNTTTQINNMRRRLFATNTNTPPTTSAFANRPIFSSSTSVASPETAVNRIMSLNTLPSKVNSRVNSGLRQLRGSSRRAGTHMLVGQQGNYESDAGNSTPSKITSLRFPVPSPCPTATNNVTARTTPSHCMGSGILEFIQSTSASSKENGRPMGAAAAPRTRLQLARAAMQVSTTPSISSLQSATGQQSYQYTSVVNSMDTDEIYHGVRMKSEESAVNATTTTMSGEANYTTNKAVSSNPSSTNASSLLSTATEGQRILQETHRQRYQSLENYLTLLRHMGEAYCLLTRFQCSLARQHMMTHLPPSQLNSALLMSWTARSWIEDEENDRAAVILRELHAREPWQTRGMDDYSIVLWNLNSEVELSSLANDMLHLDRRFSPIPWFVAGNCMSLHRERHIAIKYFKRAIEVHPRYALAYRLLGHEYKMQEELEKARTAYHESLRLDSRQFRTYLALSQVFYCQDLYALAQQPLLQALQIHPNSAFLLTHLGIIRANLGVYSGPDGALACLERACQLQQKPSTLSRFNLARVLIKLGHLNRALTALHELRQLAPKEATILYYISHVYKLLGQIPQHMTYLSWAKEMDPKHAGGNILNDALQPIFSMASGNLQNSLDEDGTSLHAETTLSVEEGTFLMEGSIESAGVVASVHSEVPRTADDHSASPLLFTIPPPLTEVEDEESSSMWFSDIS